MKFAFLKIRSHALRSLTKIIVVALAIGCSNSSTPDGGLDVGNDIADTSQTDVRRDIPPDIRDTKVDGINASDLADTPQDLIEDMGPQVPELPEFGFGDAVGALKVIETFEVMDDGKIQAIGFGSNKYVGVTLPNADLPITPEAWSGLIDFPRAILGNSKFVVIRPYFWVFTSDWSLASSGILDCTRSAGGAPSNEGFVYVGCNTGNVNGEPKDPGHIVIDFRNPAEPVQITIPIDENPIKAFKEINGTVFGLQISRSRDMLEAIAVDGSGTFTPIPLVADVGPFTDSLILDGETIWTIIPSLTDSKFQRIDLSTGESRLFEFPVLGEGMKSFEFDEFDVVGETLYVTVFADPEADDEPFLEFLLAIDLSDPDNPRLSEPVPISLIGQPRVRATQDAVYYNRPQPGPGESLIVKVDTSQFVFP